MSRHKKIKAGFIAFFCLFLACLGEAKAKTRFDANMLPLYEDCLSECSRPGMKGNLTREGCLKGCAQMRRMFLLNEKRYSSYAKCLEDLEDIELNRDLMIEKYQKWCDKKYSHIHKRIGCKDAITTFMKSATFGNVCGRQFSSPITIPVSSSPIPLHEATPLAPVTVVKGVPIDTPVAPKMQSSSNTVTNPKTPLAKKSEAQPSVSRLEKKATVKQTSKKTTIVQPQRNATLPAKEVPKKDAPLPGNQTYPGYVPPDTLFMPAIPVSGIHPKALSSTNSSMTKGNITNSTPLSIPEKNTVPLTKALINPVPSNGTGTLPSSTSTAPSIPEKNTKEIQPVLPSTQSVTPLAVEVTQPQEQQPMIPTEAIGTPIPVALPSINKTLPTQSKASYPPTKEQVLPLGKNPNAPPSLPYGLDAPPKQ